MKPNPAASRRFLSTSPFNKQVVPEPPAEQYAVQDLVTHDKYGLGRVVSIEDTSALTVDFGSQLVRIQAPYSRMSKL
jgi:hypothetical protein